jgi:hypothetical protein
MQQKSATQSGGTRLYWWSYPSRVALFVTLPIYLFCWSLNAATFDFYGHNHKFLTGPTAILGLAAILAFAACAFLVEPRAARREAVVLVDPASLNPAVNVLTTVVLAAYTIFLFPILLKPQLLIELVMGSQTAMFTLRETLNRIPGVTSLMSLQSLLAVTIVGYKGLTGTHAPKLYTRALAIVAGLCLLRAWLWSERLALIEFVVPVIVVALARFEPPRGRTSFRPLVLAPLAGLVALFAFFLVGEYFRSWQHYQHTFAGSFPEFIATRLAGYYATALNNGAAVITLLEPFEAPTMTAQWFYKFPFWQFVAPSWSYESFDVMSFLEAYLNPEFNNMSGIFLPLADFGPGIGIAFWMGLGLITGLIFNSFALGGITGFILYPVWFTGLIEMLRIFYWGETRFFPVLFGALILASYLKRCASQRATPLVAG